MLIAVGWSLHDIYNNQPNAEFIKDDGNRKNIYIAAVGSLMWCIIGKVIMYLVISKENSQDIGVAELGGLEHTLWFCLSMIGGFMYPFASANIQQTPLFEWAELFCLVEKVADMGGDAIMKKLANYIDGDNKSTDLLQIWGCLFDLASLGVSIFIVFCAISKQFANNIPCFKSWSSVWVYLLSFFVLCGYDFFNKLANFSMNAIVDIRVKTKVTKESDAPDRKKHRDNKSKFINTWSTIFNAGYLGGCSLAIGYKLANKYLKTKSEDIKKEPEDSALNSKKSDLLFYGQLIFFGIYFAGIDGIVTFLMQIPANKMSDRTQQSMADIHKDPVEHNLKYGMVVGAVAFGMFMLGQYISTSDYRNKTKNFIENDTKEIKEEQLREGHQKKVSIYAIFSIFWGLFFLVNAARWWIVAEDNYDDYDTTGKSFFENSFSLTYNSFLTTAVSSGAISPLFFTMQSMLVFLGNGDTDKATNLNIIAKFGTAVGRFAMPLLSLQCGVTDQAMTVLGYGMALVGVVFVNGLALRAKDLEPDFDVLKMKKETFLQNKKIKEFPEELAELIGRGKQD
jgi:hypothetical protein